LSPDDREAIIETIDAEVAAEALSEMDMDVRQAFSNRSRPSAPPRSSRRWPLKRRRTSWPN
jgi:hypothetical protein